jgi:hypothetical protein
VQTQPDPVTNILLGKDRTIATTVGASCMLTTERLRAAKVAEGNPADTSHLVACPRQLFDQSATSWTTHPVLFFSEIDKFVVLIADTDMVLSFALCAGLRPTGGTGSRFAFDISGFEAF